jgi:hypothetical protein
VAVAHSVTSESHSGTTGSANEASFSWTHAEGITPSSVLVFVFTINSPDKSLGVTYGGVALSRVPSSTATDSTTEPGCVTAWFKAGGLPSGNQTVEVTRTNDIAVMYAVSVTQVASGTPSVVGVSVLEGNQAPSQVSVDDGSPGTNSQRYAAAYYGGNSPATQGANSTGGGNAGSIDFGSFGCSIAYETTPGQGSRLVGFDSSLASDDYAAVYLAVKETAGVTYEKTGNAISPRAGSGAKAVTFTEAGLAARPMVASGPKRFNGIDYVKAGIAVMGTITGNVFTKAGTAIAALAASGTDAVTSVETGLAATPMVAAGGDVATLAKTGLAATELTGSGADVATSVETGAAVTPLSASGAKGGFLFEKAGAAVTTLTTLGDAALTFTETGAAVMEMVASGTKTVQSSTTYTKTGTAIMGVAPANTFTKTGTAVSARTGSGADAVTFVEESNGLEFPEPPSLEGPNPPQMTMSASGSKVVTSAGIFTKTGTAITGFTGSGADAVTFAKTGAGVSTRAGSGADQVTFVESGTAVSIRVASGSKEMATGAGTTFSKTGTAISTRTASGAKVREITKTGAAISTRTGGGADATTYSELGAGILVRVASGGNAVTSVETGTAIRGHTASGVSAGSNKWLTPHDAPAASTLTPIVPTSIVLTPAVVGSDPLLTPKARDSH